MLAPGHVLVPEQLGAGLVPVLQLGHEHAHALGPADSGPPPELLNFVHGWPGFEPWQQPVNALAGRLSDSSEHANSQHGPAVIQQPSVSVDLHSIDGDHFIAEKGKLAFRTGHWAATLQWACTEITNDMVAVAHWRWLPSWIFVCSYATSK